MKQFLALAAVCLSLSLAASAAVQVTVTTPANGAHVNSPFALAASATSSYSITGWVVYLDGVSVYTAGAVNSINASIPASSGTHQLVTRAWDSTGAYGSINEQITAGSGSGTGIGGGLAVGAAFPFLRRGNCLLQH